MSHPAKPPWLRVRAPNSPACRNVLVTLQRHDVHTVCQEAQCPNIGECFSRMTATFMLLGDTCTRRCGYCAVRHGKPAATDAGEPQRVADAVSDLGLKYVVITSVTRDDLPDGGASIFADTIRRIGRTSPGTGVEVLIPDLRGDRKALRKVVNARPTVLGHNVEVAKRLFAGARPQGNYGRSLELLKAAMQSCATKSGFMVGLGETADEILETMEDLAQAAHTLSIGQYLRPSKRHLPVARYYTPAEFAEFREIGAQMGFKHVEAGPLVRSSYHADKYPIPTA